MSKDLALQQTEWDLHENPELFIPLEFTEEVQPNLFGLETEKATEMVIGLSSTLAEREVLKKSYTDVIELEITTENLSVFKDLRLKIRDNRTKGIQKWKEREKAFYLAGGNFIQAIYNKEAAVNEEMESKLLNAEKHFENLEKQKAKDLNDARIERLRPFVEDVTGLDFAPMSDEDFDDYLLGKKTRFENAQKEAEAEALRIETEKERQRVFSENKNELLPWSQWIENFEEIDFETVDLISVLTLAKAKKSDAEKIAKEQEIENERLRKEAEEKEKAFAIERDKAKAEADRIEAENNVKLEKERAEAKAKQDEIELKAKQEREKASKIQAEKDAEIAKLKAIENAKIEAERLAKIEADKLAKAPIKKQLEVWVKSFELPECSVENETSKEIIEKFLAFKKWSSNQVNNL